MCSILSIILFDFCYFGICHILVYVECRCIFYSNVFFYNIAAFVWAYYYFEWQVTLLCIFWHLITLFLLLKIQTLCKINLLISVNVGIDYFRTIQQWKLSDYFYSCTLVIFLSSTVRQIIVCCLTHTLKKAIDWYQEAGRPNVTCDQTVTMECLICAQQQCYITTSQDFCV